MIRAYVRMGMRGREILMREHSPEDVCVVAPKLIDSSARYAPVLASLRLADRAAEHMRHFTHPHNRKLVRHVEANLNSISSACSTFFPKRSGTMTPASSAKRHECAQSTSDVKGPGSKDHLHSCPPGQVQGCRAGCS